MTKEEDSYVPENNIELSMLYTNPVWGSDQEINDSFRDRTTKTVQFVNSETGQVVRTTEDKLWEQLQFFTRDLRLGNLTSAEMRSCEYYLNFASDTLKEKYVDAFIVALSKVATMIELSQSRGGFLRKRLNTFTKENRESFEAPKKNGLFHQSKNKY
jgi:hypothetical protein